MSWFRRTPIDSARWVVLDCETSGLDPAHDRLLSVGAIAVRAGEIRLPTASAPWWARRTPSAPENILVHGIGGDTQRAAVRSPRSSRAARVRRRGGAGRLPCAVRRTDPAPPRAQAPGRLDRSRDPDAGIVSQPRPAAVHARALAGRVSVPAESRHDALGDAFAAAQLLLVVLAELKRQRLSTSKSSSRPNATPGGSRGIE